MSNVNCLNRNSGAQLQFQNLWKGLKEGRKEEAVVAAVYWTKERAYTSAEEMEKI